MEYIAGALFFVLILTLILLLPRFWPILDCLAVMFKFSIGSSKPLKRRLSSVAGRDLVWVRTKLFGEQHELRFGDDVLAKVRGGWFGNSMGEAVEGQWVFKRHERMWDAPVSFTVHEAMSDTEIVWADLRGRTGEIEFLDGRRFRWDGPPLWLGQLTFTDRTGTILIRFEKSLFGRRQVRIEEAAVSIPELSLLVLLGWFVSRDPGPRTVPLF